MWYFVVFQPSKCKKTHFQPQIWSIWPIFPNDSESLPKFCYIKQKNSEILSKLRNSESAGGSGQNRPCRLLSAPVVDAVSRLLNFVDGSMTSLLTFTEHKKLDCKFQTVNLSNSKREQITSFKIILGSSTFFLVIDATCLRTPMPLKANMPILTP